jgi:hypothetical protein
MVRALVAFLVFTGTARAEPFFDEPVKKNFSASAAEISNVLITTTVAMPLALQLGGGLDDEAGQRLRLYGETVGGDLVLNTIVKYLARRSACTRHTPG